ncbi:MAG: OmpA family protein [Chitinophagaceae bacterium]|nr:MAG: OmpA family protein [Chitinophagaceae bacterium]
MICLKIFLTIAIAACMSPCAGFGQELVVNGSFDEPNVCIEYEAKCAPAAWFYVYATGPGWGYKPKINNSPYAIQLFSARSKDNTRSFWQSMLTQPVIPGQEYVIKLDVSADNGLPNMNDIGVVLTSKMQFAMYAEYKLPDKYISLTDALITKLNNGWYRVTKTVLFTDSLQVVVIGNFNPKSNAQIIKDRKNKDGFIVTNIDNLSLVRKIQPGANTNFTKDAVEFSLKDSLYKIRERHRDLYELANRKTILPLVNGSTQKKLNTVADTLIIPDVAFAFDSYQLIDRPFLVQQLQPILRGKISRVIVEGFTDSKGSIGYNDTLSIRRAGTVASLLTAEFPLVKYLTESRGSGISRKYDDENKNRRVEIIIYKEQE